MSKQSVTLDKPIYGGATILDLSKILMGKFFYNFIKKKFGQRYQLLFTDTDSFMGIVQSDNVYQELAPDISTFFDTSNYPEHHKLFSSVNKKVPGFFKDEMGGGCISEFCGLRAKQYAYRKVDVEKKNATTSLNTTKRDILRCKGVNTQAMKNICFEDYYACLFNNEPKHVTMCTIRSKKHVNYTLSQQKKALDANDDKRCILQNRIDTIPWGSTHDTTL